MNSQETTQGNPVVVITGASSGIGREVARQMSEKHFTVYDLSRTERPQEGVSHLTCDVTNRDSIKTAINTVIERSSRIDILILCAGSGVAGALEMMTEEEILFQFDVNAHGPLRVAQAALPYIRNQQLNCNGERGRILFISSVGAIFPLPFQGLYSATKTSVNAIAYAMRNELHPFHIHVSSILPGDVKTGFTAARKSNTNGSEIYTHMNDAFEAMASDEINGSSPVTIAGRIVKIAMKKRLKMYYTLDWLSKAQYMLQNIAPHSLILYVLRKMYKC